MMHRFTAPIAMAAECVRERTDQPIMRCMQALRLVDNNVEAACELLRVPGHLELIAQETRIREIVREELTKAGVLTP
jgi:translation elongation factor EF-Ts